MANLNDPDAEAFFRQGDEGTYSGGPGDSIPAGVVDVFDDIEDESLPKVTHEHIKRRDRYTRWVTGFVSVLGAAAVLGFVVRAVAGDGEPSAPKTVAVQSPAAVETPRQPEVAPAPVVDRGVREEKTAESTPVPPPAPVADEPPRVVTKRADEAAHSAAKAPRVSEKRVDRSLRSSAVTTVYPAAKPPAAPAAFGHSSPPTANFPN